MLKSQLPVLALLLLGALSAFAQQPDVPFNPRSYMAYLPVDSIRIDGQLTEKSWELAAYTDSFIDIEGSQKPNPNFDTRLKMLWDDTYLYIGAYLEEPHIWGRLTQRDTVIFYDNDFEVFIDPDGDTHNYYELEINALGTLWDLLLTKPYRDGGKAIDGWDISGIKSAVSMYGTINDPSDQDSAWTVELALPWSILEEAALHNGAPNNNEQWRINFSRVQWHTEIRDGKYIKKRDPESGNLLQEENWVWSPQGVINMHYPEMWGYLQFAELQVGKDKVPVSLSADETIKWYLRRLYYKQHQFRKEHGVFSNSADDLKTLMNAAALPNGVVVSKMNIVGGPHTFEIALRDTSVQSIWYIREDGKIWNQPYK